MTGPVPAHGEPQHFGAPATEQHHPAPGFGAPSGYAQTAPAVIDYTGGAAPYAGAPVAAATDQPGAYQQVQADNYAAAAAEARHVAEMDARAQLAEEQADRHPDDQRHPPGEAAADMRAEVDAEQAEPTVTRSPAPEGSFEVTLANRISGDTDTIRILDPIDWPSSANSALHVGEYESWAEACLAPGDYEQVWLAINPSLGDVNRMFEEWRKKTGRDQGKSGRSPASLKRAARR